MIYKCAGRRISFGSSLEEYFCWCVFSRFFLFWRFGMSCGKTGFLKKIYNPERSRALSPFRVFPLFSALLLFFCLKALFSKPETEVSGKVDCFFYSLIFEMFVVVKNTLDIIRYFIKTISISFLVILQICRHSMIVIY